MQFVVNLGVDLSSKLSDLLGGQCVYVSMNGYISSISRHLNASDSEKLKQYYACLKVYIPMNIENVEITMRNEKIRKRLKMGGSINLVASEFGLSRRQIFRIKNENK